MKKFILSLVIAMVSVVGFISCSEDDDFENSNHSNINVFGTWKIESIYDYQNICNIDTCEYFVLYENYINYQTCFMDDDNCIGEFYIYHPKYPTFSIESYSFKNNILTISGGIRNIEEFKDNYTYTYQFKIINYSYQKYIIYECIQTDRCNPLVIPIGTKIKLKYLGYTFGEWTNNSENW